MAGVLYCSLSNPLSWHSTYIVMLYTSLRSKRRLTSDSEAHAVWSVVTVKISAILFQYLPVKLEATKKRKINRQLLSTLIFI